MIAWFARNSVAANLLLITIVIAGVFSLTRLLTVEVFPSFDVNAIRIATVYEGTTPEEIEEGVTIKIEEEIADISGIEEIESSSVENRSTIIIKVSDDFELDDVLDDIKSRVDSINGLPSESERPTVSQIEVVKEVITVAVYGAADEKTLREYADEVRDDISQIDGISKVALSGTRDYEMLVEVSQDKLQAYNLSLDEVSRAIQNSSVSLSAGNLKTASGDVLLRLNNQAYSVQNFQNIVIKSEPSGRKVYLRDIADIQNGFEDKDVKIRFNGEPAIWVDVSRVGKQNAMDVSNKVKRYIENQSANLPKGINLSYRNDRARLIKSRLNTLIRSALQGGILVVLLLALFLRPAVAFWVSLGIPISFLGGLIAMQAFGISINLISLFAFITVLGIVVDDAIVTGENVYRHIQMGKQGLQASIDGTHEVSVPVTFGVLTTIAAFIPMLLLDGERGQVFFQIPAVVIPVLLFSLVESKLILPAHLKNVKVRSQNEMSSLMQRQQQFSKGFENFIVKRYKPILEFCLQNKFLTMASIIAIGIVLYGAVMTSWLKFIFFPRIDSEQVRVELQMPVSTPFAITAKHVDYIFDLGLQIQEKYRDEESGKSLVIQISSETGASNAHTGRVRMELQSPSDRHVDVSIKDVVKEWRSAIGEIPGAESLSFRAEIGRAGDPVNVLLKGNDLNQMNVLAEDVKEFLNDYAGVFDIKDTFSDGKVEFSVELKEAGKALGINEALLSRQLRQAFFGVTVQSFQRGSNEVDVVLKLPIEERKSIESINNFYVNTGTGHQVLFSDVARLSPSISPIEIKRFDGERTLNITADIEKEKVQVHLLKQEIEQLLTEKLAIYDNDISFTLEGEAKEQKETFSSLIFNTFILFFIIYALLAIPFKSYVQPFVVMSIIPLGLMGAILGHVILGVNLSIMSVLGIVALLGVVVNDSLVLVDFINQQRRKGVDIYEAISSAGVMRFRPVILTSLTTFAGLMPLLLETSTQAQFLKPMAISLGFGILFATITTLLVVPVVYLSMFNARQSFRKSVYN